MNLFIELRKHGKLAAKRNPMYEKNKFGKFWMYFMAVFWAGYLVFFGTSFAFAFNNGATEAYHVLNSGLIFILCLDFLMRFPFQKTPAQEVKPYLLLPVKRNRLIDSLLIRSGLNGFNLIWLFFFVPFAIISITRFYGITGVLTYSIGIWLLMVLNNYWFLLCRTLMNERVWWIILPILAYGSIAAGMLVPDNSPLFDWSVDLGEGFILGHLLTFTGVFAAIVVLWFINRGLMIKLIYNEINKVEDTKVKHVSEYKFLDRYGDVGEYLRLELKLCFRNKTVKTQFRMGFIIMLAFSALIAFTDVYDGTGMINFICIYNFAILSIMTLGQVMSFEGNYLDGLMSRKESIYNLLRAKYYLNCIIVFIPFLIMMIPVAKGKIPFLMALSYMLFTAGFVFAMMLQLAVYNKKTLPLNANVMRSNRGSSLFQTIIISCAFFLPLIINKALTAFFEQDTACIIMMIIGLLLIATHNIWIKNIYNRFMKRRYENMEGFRDSR